VGWARSGHTPSLWKGGRKASGGAPRPRVQNRWHCDAGLNQDQSVHRARETHWGSHYRTLSGLVQLFPLVISVLKYVAKEGKRSSKKSEARGLLSCFGTFDFVFYLHMMLHILGSANTLSHALQRKDQDTLNAMTFVKSTKNDLQQLRDNGWESLLEKVYSFCEEHGILKLNMHDEYSNQHNTRQKTNITNLHHYKVECLNSVIDWQLRECDDRFNEVIKFSIAYSHGIIQPKKKLVRCF
jgi:hypothetical protein